MSFDSFFFFLFSGTYRTNRRQSTPVEISGKFTALPANMRFSLPGNAYRQRLDPDSHHPLDAQTDRRTPYGMLHTMQRMLSCSGQSSDIYIAKPSVVATSEGVSSLAPYRVHFALHS